jgi:opacity protein-like surface antigen
LYGSSSSVTKDLGRGFSAGVNVQFRLRKSISIKTGISYERKGAEFEYIIRDDNGVLRGNTKYKSDYNYIILPILGYLASPKERWYLESGPYLGYLIDRIDHYDSVGLTPGMSYNYTKDTKRFDFGWSIGIGHNIKLSDNVFMNIGIIENLGLVNTSKGELIVKTNSFGFNLGVKYSLN